MTHDENRISDLIDGGLHEKSAIDKAKYELHMRQKAAIEEAAIKAWEADAVHNPNPNNPHAYVYGFKAGAQTILENPGEWGLVESSVMETCRKLRLRITEHEAENQRLREALEKISTPIHGEYPDIETVNWIAKEALKQEVNND